MNPLAHTISPLLLNHKLLYNEDYVHIYYNFVDHWLYADWIGSQSTETIKAGAEILLKAVKDTKTNKLINDNTHITEMKADTVEWLSQDFAPRLQAAGLQYLAWIYKTNSVSEISADNVISLSQSDTIIIVFDIVSTAEKWLKSVH